MLNSNSQKLSNLEESKEAKKEISNKTEVTVDDAKKSKLTESNADVIRVSQNSNSHTGNCELFCGSIVFHAIISLYATYWTC